MGGFQLPSVTVALENPRGSPQVLYIASHVALMISVWRTEVKLVGDVKEPWDPAGLPIQRLLFTLPCLPG